MADSDFRFDPFTFKYLPKNITGEVKTVEFFPAFRRCGFFLSETPQRLTSAPMRVICGGDTLAEVSRISAPGVNNFRVDYGNVNNFAQTGFVEIHADRIGQVASINYRGLGNNLNASHRADAVPNIQRSIRTPLNATAAGLTMTALEIAAGISAKNKRFGGVNAVIAGDLVSLAQFIGLNRRPQPVFLSGSGNYVFPSNVKKVLFVLIGPGGNGHISGGGGGGGAAVYGVADLETIGGDMFAYVVGIVGIATTMFGCVAGAGSSASASAGGSGGTASVGTGVVGVPASGGNPGGGLFVSVALGSTDVQTSADGINWTLRTGAISNGTMAIAFGNRKFVALNSLGFGEVMTSSDGVTWATQSASDNNAWNSIVYGNGVFLACASSGTNRTMVSTDGVSWSSNSSSGTNPWTAAVYGNGKFIIFASQSFSNSNYATSTDGVTWNVQSLGFQINSAKAKYLNGQFILIGSSAPNYIATSPDGVTWTLRASGLSSPITLYDVTYGNGLYVVVGSSGTVITSPDGVTWTSRTAAAANTWATVSWGAGLFTAISFDGTNRVQTSPDGITWISRSAAANSQWLDIIYTGDGGGAAAGGLGGKTESPALGQGAINYKFFSGSGGGLDSIDGESFGGGGGAGGNGAPGAILLLY